MTSSLQENVKMYVLSQGVTRFCMINFGNSPKKLDLIFIVNYILKRLTLKMLKFSFYVMDYHKTF